MRFFSSKIDFFPPKESYSPKLISTSEIVKQKLKTNLKKKPIRWKAIKFWNMTSVFHQGKYRQRKDWSTSSIPELVCLEEETSQIGPEISTSLPPKAPRRSSLAIGLLVGGRGATDPKYKRRSSIATAFLGRQNKVIFLSLFFFHFFIHKIYFLNHFSFSFYSIICLIIIISKSR